MIIDLLTGSHEAVALPTGLVSGDVHCGELRCVGALVGNTIDCLDLKAVLRVGLQVTDRYATLGQAQVARRDVDIVVTA